MFGFASETSRIVNDLSERFGNKKSNVHLLTTSVPLKCFSHVSWGALNLPKTKMFAENVGEKVPFLYLQLLQIGSVGAIKKKKQLTHFSYIWKRMKG